MKQILCLLLFILNTNVYVLYAQQKQLYNKIITEHRINYAKEFISDVNSPLTKDDTAYLRFYQPDIHYKIIANFTRINDKVGFDMQTLNGVVKKYFVYGSITFKIHNTLCTLYVYQSEKLKTKEGFENYLFIPFTDNTNYTSTFGGGRYIDCSIKDIKNNKLEIDFNKCYNPYCAYKEGYACPIPPKENDLKIEIKAGEKLFAKSLDDTH